MGRRGRRALALLAASAAAVALSACGDDDTAEGAAGSAPDESCETVTVDIPEFAFDPTPVEIDACDSVVWRNAHDQAHTSTGDGDMTWGTGNIAPGEESDPVTFGDAGTFTYICALHPFMQGEVSVA